MEMMQRAYVLHRKDGELIFLFEERAMPRERAMRLWRHAASTGSLAISITILAMLTMWYFRTA
jgi:hypothetical protein